MFLQSLRQSIGYYSNSLKRNRQCTKSWADLSEVESLIILADVDSQSTYALYDAMRKQFKELCPKAQFTSILFVEKSELTDFTGISDYEKHFISADSFSFFFRMADKDLLRKFAPDYDLAVNLCCSSHPYLDFLFGGISAGLKVGKSGLRDEQLNFMISSATMADLCRDVVAHLRMFFHKP